MDDPTPRPVAVLLARGRFVALVGLLLALVWAWPTLQNYADKLTHAAPAGGAVAAGTEYWCPMCPGVVSDWPAKCPVCHMALVRREAGDMTPLPDGVVARVQLSPYRLQLAGVRTSPVGFVKLEQAVTAGGFLDSAGASPTFAADLFDRDAALLAVGNEGTVTCDSYPGETFVGRVTELSGRRVRIRVENPRGDLRPGSYVAATFRVPVARLDAARRAELDRWRDHVAASLRADGGLAALLDAGVRHAAARDGFALAVPESAVIDTGPRQVVYVESMPGTFDAVEVRLGRRCGDVYPVRSGLELGQRVATAGAVLLDAETRLNPGVAAAYFGSGPRSAAPPPPSATDDRALIAKQKVCPVTDGDLDAMGGAVKLVVDGRVVFVCCQACEKPLRRKPAEYLSKLPK